MIVLWFFYCTTYPKFWKLKWDYYVIIFSMHLTDVLFSLLYFPWLHIFLHGASFFRSFFSSTTLWMWCSVIGFMLILVLLRVVHEALCVSVLTCTILVWQLNKIFGILTQTIKSLHGIYYMVLKYVLLCDTNSKIVPGLHGCRNKSYFLSDPLKGCAHLRQAWEGTINIMEKFCMCSGYLFDVFIGYIAYTATFKKIKSCIISSE